MTEPNKRDELIKEVVECNWLGGAWNAEQIADYVLSREQRLLEEIEKPLKQIKRIVNNKYDWYEINRSKANKKVDEALSIIQRHREGL